MRRLEHQCQTCQFWCSLANYANRAAWCWAVSTGPTRGRQTLKPPSWSLFRTVWFRNIHTSRSFCRALQCLSCSSFFAAGLLPFYGPVQLCSCNLLVSPPCSWDYAADTPNVPAMTRMLDYLCNLIGLQVLPHGTSIEKDPDKHKTSDNSVRKDKERTIVFGHHLQNNCLFGGCLAAASPVWLISLNFNGLGIILSSVPTLVKMIKKNLYIKMIFFTCTKLAFVTTIVEWSCSVFLKMVESLD